MENNDRIELLPHAVVEKIAAGETIERPASVLKELIENAVDAGADVIDIIIEDAGFSCIRVADNGRGMSPDNVRKSILRHATSKIRTADDLYALSTMGFRGEALASIAAVSRMTITSSDSEEGLGYSLQCDGSEAGEVSPDSHARGTTVTVRDLFYNVPARKKFMKSRKGERMALIRLIEQLAVPFPSIHFRAEVEGKPALDFPPEQSVPMRISHIAGIQFAKNLIPCSGNREGMEAIIYLSSPEEARQRPRFQDLYVNLRRVENDQVLFAVREAFAHFISTEFRPSFFCFLTIDPARIDVNVHPTKLKIKFDEERMIFGFIFDTVRRGIEPTRVGPNEILSGPLPMQDPGSRRPDTALQPAVSGIEPGSVHEMSAPWHEGFPSTQSGIAEQQTSIPFTIPDREKKDLEAAYDNKIQLAEGGKGEPWGLIPCYQIHGMFILAPIKNGILLIDQHAAHERILYEQALTDYLRGSSESQQLLFPIIIEFAQSEKEAVIGGNGFFSAVGFDIQDFGGNAVSVSAIPAFMKDSEVESSVREMVRYLLGEKNEQFFPESHKRFAAAFACGAAIKAGQKLSQEEMNALLNNLFGSENPYICPHGRPTIVRMSVDEIGRRFLR